MGHLKIQIKRRATRPDYPHCKYNDRTCAFALGSLACSKKGDMMEETLDPNCDAFQDQIRFPYPFTGEPNCEVLVPGAAKVQGDAWIRERIEGWFINHPKPLPGTSTRIPEYQFDPTLFQPSRIIPRRDGSKRRSKARPKRGGSNRGSGRSVGGGSSSVAGKKRPRRRSYRRTGKRR
jgi:hypothetical protein